MRLTPFQIQKTLLEPFEDVPPLHLPPFSCLVQLMPSNLQQDLTVNSGKRPLGETNKYVHWLPSKFSLICSYVGQTTQPLVIYRHFSQKCDSKKKKKMKATMFYVSTPDISHGWCLHADAAPPTTCMLDILVKKHQREGE